jgi:hypothetical protein
VLNVRWILPYDGPAIGGHLSEVRQVGEVGLFFYHNNIRGYKKKKKKNRKYSETRTERVNELRGRPRAPEADNLFTKRCDTQRYAFVLFRIFVPPPDDLHIIYYNIRTRVCRYSVNYHSTS